MVEDKLYIKAVESNDGVELRKQAGRWLKSRRESLGISQRVLADRVDMEYYTFISQIEAGRGRVPAERFKHWAAALEVDPKVFATTLMKFYDPYTYEMIFGLSEIQNLD